MPFAYDRFRRYVDPNEHARAGCREAPRPRRNPVRAGLDMLGKTVGTDLRGHAATPSLWAQLLNDQRIVALFFLLPTIVVLCFVVIYPFFSAIVISFALSSRR